MKWYEKQKSLYEQNTKDAEETNETVEVVETVESTGQTDHTDYTETIEEPVSEPVLTEVKPSFKNIQVDEVGKEKPMQTVIGKSTTLNGDVKSDGDILVYGTIKGNVACDSGDVKLCGEVEGKITCENITLEHAILNNDVTCTGNLQMDQDSSINGNIYAAGMYINGTVQGTINASEFVHLSKTTRVVGSINSLEIEIERGAVVQGDIKIQQ